MDAVSHLLNVPISYYVQTDFEGFSKIVDILGGIEMVVEREMIHKTRPRISHPSHRQAGPDGRKLAVRPHVIAR